MKQYLWFLVPLAGVAAAQITLPEGRGRDVFEATCSECHTLDRIVTLHQNEEGWRNILREMTENGAAFNPGDLQLILAYLSKNFGPLKVNVNTATAEQLAAVLKLTPEEAREIVANRLANGPYRSLADLKNLPVAGPKVEAVKDSIEF